MNFEVKSKLLGLTAEVHTTKAVEQHQQYLVALLIPKWIFLGFFLEKNSCANRNKITSKHRRYRLIKEAPHGSQPEICRGKQKNGRGYISKLVWNTAVVLKYKI